MSVAIVTGSAGLIGAEAARYFADLGFTVAGVDNNMREYFFGADGSTADRADALQRDLGASYEHHALDVRDRDGIAAVFARYAGDIGVVIHAAAQPSHDWAAREPLTDFDVNAVGTLVLLEAARESSPDAPFIFCSTNKVYGDRPNTLPYVELETRWEIEPGHPYEKGIPEDMSIDQCLHSVFGAGKVAADVLVQEYGRYFDMPTGTFRGGTLTGPGHAAAELHGFLAYVMRCAMEGREYRIFGYKGKQVRDAIHSHDLLTAFDAFRRSPRCGEVYNMGGGRFSNCSVLEALDLAGGVVGAEVARTYVDDARIGDHIWWISDTSRFEEHYPEWRLQYDVPAILREIYEANAEAWSPTVSS